MSISVKNISLSVNGTPSNQFNIELDGAKYSIEDVKMTQRLLEPCRLEFKLRKTPQEDISEIQFTTCGSIIGKDVTLSMQTDSVEQEISGFAAGSQNADIEFEGFVTQAKATRCETAKDGRPHLLYCPVQGEQLPVPATNGQTLW